MVRTLAADTIPAHVRTIHFGPLRTIVSKARPLSRKHAAALRVIGGKPGLSWISDVLWENQPISTINPSAAINTPEAAARRDDQSLLLTVSGMVFFSLLQ